MIVDVFQDTICPWCRIGKQHLKTALAQWEGQVEVRYHPFFLNPNTPPEGYDFKTYMAAKFGGRERLDSLFEGSRKAGTAAGLVFNFDQIGYAPNTLNSHRLMALTPDAHKDAMLDAIHKAYFQDGLNIGDIEVLAQIAGANGLDETEIAAQLRSDAMLDEVLAETEWAANLGVTGVPLFVFNGALALSGAHPPQTILNAMRQASQTAQV
ncbi:MAG: DsbA family oxidoreductase [Anaerolineae bacterium]|nr:DsbA family oxidoreductase [Anaerolineae bacterium]